MAATDIFVRIKGVDKISGMLKGIKGRVGGLGKALKVAGLLGAAALIGVGIAALKFGDEFKKAKNIIIAGTGASGKALDGLYGNFKKVFAAIPTDMDKAAAAVADWNTLMGLSGDIVEEVSILSLEAARVLGEDSAGLIKAGAKAFNIFEIAGEDVPLLLDKVLVASQATGVPMTKLLGVVQTYGPVLKNMGFGFEDTVAFMSSMEKAGIDITRVMPGLNKFSRDLATQGITDLKGALFDTIEEIKGATTSSEALNIATESFGAEGAQRMSIAIRTGALDVEDLVKQMDGAEGAILETSEATMTWQDKLKRLRNRALVKLEPLLSKFLDLIGVAADWLGVKLPLAVNLFIGGFTEMDVTCKGVHGTIEEFGVMARKIFDALVPVVKTLWKHFKSGLSVIAPLVGDFVKFILSKKPLLIAAIAAIGVAMVLAFGPAALAVIAIVGLIALIGFLKDNWTEIEEVFTRVIDDIIDTVENIPVIGEIFKGTMKAIKIVVTTVFKLIKNRIETVIKVVRAIIKTVTALIRGDWSAAWEGIKELVGALWGGIKTEIKLVLGAIKDLIWIQLTTIAGIFDDVFGGIVRKVVKKVVNLKNKITKTFQAVVSWVKRRWPLLLAILTGPFGLAVYAIIKKKDAIVRVIVGLRNWLFGTFGHIRNAVGNIMTNLKNRVSHAFGLLRNTVRSVVNNIKDIVIGRFNNLLYNLTHLPGKFVRVGLSIGKAIVNGIINGLNFLIRKWNDFKIPSVGWGPFKTPSISTPNLPLIPSLAKGALDVAGDTLARLHKGEMVIPRAFADSLRSALTAARSPVATGGGSFNFYGDINLSGRATKADARELVDMVEHEWRSRRRRGR